MLHKFYIFQSHSIEQNIWPQTFFVAKEKRKNNSKNENITSYNHKRNQENLKEFSQQQQNAYLYNNSKNKERKCHKMILKNLNIHSYISLYTYALWL